jgi:Mor family transcriptional regulator
VSERNDAAVERLREEMVEIIGRRIGLKESVARPLAEEVVEALREHYGARAPYIPARSKKEERAAIIAAFNGRNRAEVCRKFGISRATFYRYINQKGGKA